MARRRRGYRQLVETDIDIMPLMNLFVVLIPMLLLSAVFVEISTIDMDLPSADSEVSDAPRESLELAVRVEEERYVVEGKRMKRQVIDRGSEDADARLAEVLASIHERNPKENDLRVVSERATRYQEIITVMDISRDAGLGAVSLVGNRPAGGWSSEAR